MEFLQKEGVLINIAIVEDDENSAALIKGYVERFCKENKKPVRIVCFSDGIDIASEYTADFDVIFLDIVMKHMDGLKTAEYIRKMDKKVIIVFITNDSQYALYGYSVEALGFLLKPVTYFAFSQEFKRCIGKIESDMRKYIVLSTEKGKDRIAIDKIIYIESSDHRQIINTTERTYSVYETMKKIENMLPPVQFSRCNNCYIVNLYYVRGIHGDYVSVDGGELKISRSRRKSFLEDMAAMFIDF